MNTKHSNYERLQEVHEGLLTIKDVQAGLAKGSIHCLSGRSQAVIVGEQCLTKINTSIGCSDVRHITDEQHKVDELLGIGYQPDLIMDLSIVRPRLPLYTYIREQFEGPVGTLPHYLCYRPKHGIDSALLIDEIQRQAEAGVSWMTLHLAVRRELYNTARRTRLTPATSRGGGIIIDDMFTHDRSESVLSILFPDILKILKKHGTGLSLGTAFRPANTVDALDAVHRSELALQRQYIDEAHRQGVGVMLEAVGHMRLDLCASFVQFVRRELAYDLPIMTLGPIPTDAAVGEDHIANAIGGSYLAMLGGTDILNSITREEHTGNVPNMHSILEGLRAARIAAHSVNISRFAGLDTGGEEDIVSRRNRNYTCVVEGGLFTRSARTRFNMGCSRCGSQCPLVINFKLQR